MANFTLKELITEIKVTPLQSREGSKTVAFVGVTIGGHLALKDMKVVEGSNGLFVSMPQRKATIQGEEKWMDIYHTITKEGRQELNDAVLAAYEQAVNGGGGGSSNRSSNSGGSNRSSNTSSRSTGSAPAGAGARGGNTGGRGGRNDDDVPF